MPRQTPPFRHPAAVTFAVLVLAATAWANVALAQGGGGPAMVRVDEVIMETADQTVPVIGRFVARRAGEVAARTDGTMVGFAVDVGDRVAEGDELASLDQEIPALQRDLARADVAEAEASLQEAEALLTQAQQELQRLDSLRQSTAFSPARFEDQQQEVARLQGGAAVARAALARTRASLRLVEIQLGYATIRAPYPGVVTERHTEIGAYVRAGAPIVSLVNDTDLEIEADVPAFRLDGLESGRAISARVEDGVPMNVRVRAIVPDENPRTRTRIVRFVLDDGEITDQAAANQSVTLFVPIGDPEPVVTVAKDAVISGSRGSMVFVAAQGMAQPRPVVLGPAVGARFSVTSGLAPGDLVVVRGNERLRPGQPITWPGAEEQQQQATPSDGAGQG